MHTQGEHANSTHKGPRPRNDHQTTVPSQIFFSITSVIQQVYGVNIGSYVMYSIPRPPGWIRVTSLKLKNKDLQL